MQNFTKTQIAALASATEGTLNYRPVVDGSVDYSVPATPVTGIVVKGHRNAMHALRTRGLVLKGHAGADNTGLLTEAGIAALASL